MEIVKNMQSQIKGLTADTPELGKLAEKLAKTNQMLSEIIKSLSMSASSSMDKYVPSITLPNGSFGLKQGSAFDLTFLAKSVEQYKLFSEDLLAQQTHSIEAAITNAQSQGISGYQLEIILPIIAGVTALIALIAKVGSSPFQGEEDDCDALTTLYNPEMLAQFWERRPVAVMQRSAQLAAEALSFGTGLLVDIAGGNLKRNSPKRARQLRLLIERLGPAYIKVAQALSTRVDILDVHYLVEIERLQDRVPPFDDKIARLQIAKAFGVSDPSIVFKSLTSSPVAAASLGQVYRGELRDSGRAVAIKVRRPDVLPTVALDLYLMRNIAAALRKVPSVRSDWVGIIDEWALRFFEEMAYEKEAANAERFARDVEDENLVGIIVPQVVHCTDDVLVTEWIEGERLYESTAGDVRKLCNTLLSSYLVGLLDTGFLHSDPHPGNLLRTPEGKIAILDYGLMTTIPEEYSLALLEYIAHLSIKDWDSVAEDLVKLGFVAPNAPSLRESGLIEPLGRILEQLSGGGGAAKVNVERILNDLNALTANFPFFSVPPYFALILRAFSVIEGIALRVDPDYAIVQECFPYLSRRLLTDNHPRARKALKQLLFGTSEHIDIARLERLANGFSRYTVAGLSANPSVPRGEEDTTQERRSILNPATKEALEVVFSQQGSYVQELVVEEVVAVVDAAARQVAISSLGALLGSAPALASMGAIKALGPWRRIILPVPTPLEVLSRLAPALQLSKADIQALETAEGVAQLVRPQLAQPPKPDDVLQFGQEIMPLLPQLLPGVLKTSELFGRQLIRRAALRVAADMQSQYDGWND